MNKWKDFFNDEPPLGHEKRIMSVVGPELEKLSRESKSDSWEQWFASWKALSLSGLTAALVGVWIGSRSYSNKNDDLKIAAFQEEVGLILAGDLEMLISEDELDFFENIEILEELEDV